MSAVERYQIWWDDLTDDQRSAVMDARGLEVSEWLLSSLDQAGIVVIEAELADENSDHVGFLLPTALTDFVERQRQSSPS